MLTTTSTFYRSVYEDGSTHRQRDSPVTHRQGAEVALRSHETSRPGDHRSDGLRAWKSAGPEEAVGSALVPGIRVCTGIRLALERRHDDGLRRTQGRDCPAKP